jgi:hypothetical protein
MKELRELAGKATTKLAGRKWGVAGSGAVADFINNASPELVLGLLDRIEALEKDAARYCWLRDRLAIEDVERLQRDYLGQHDEAESVKCDSAVDSALLEP